MGQFSEKALASLLGTDRSQQVDRGFLFDGRQAKEDAVVACDGFYIHAKVVAQRAGHHQGPGAVHTSAEMGVYHNPQVTQRVFERLEENRSVA